MDPSGYPSSWFKTLSVQTYSDPKPVKSLPPEDTFFCFNNIPDLPPPKNTIFGYYDDLPDLPPPKETLFDYNHALDLPPASNAQFPVNGGKDSLRLGRNLQEQNDISGKLRCISDILMDDEDMSAAAIQDSTLHAAERYFSEVLHNGTTFSPAHEETSSSSDDSIGFWGSNNSDTCCTRNNDPFESAVAFDPCMDQHTLLTNSQFLLNEPLGNQCNWESNWGIEVITRKKNLVNGNGRSPAATDPVLKSNARTGNTESHSPDALPRVRKNLWREDSDDEKSRTHKQSAIHADESILHELFDDVLSLQDKKCDHALHNSDGALGNGMKNELGRGLYGESVYPKKGVTKKKAADMRNLLIECMELLARDDHRSATNVLKQIRSRSSPSGDSTQRLAHYFANSLEARMVGSGSKEHKALEGRRSMSDTSVLKAYKMYLSTFPLMEAAHFFVIETIMEQAKKASSLHIIHFGILYGLNWPPLIQRLSTRPGGPPKLHITGIDLLEPGLQPDARVKEAGRLLTECCERFNVPFEYHGIAKKWETISVKEFQLGKEEVVVVSCTYLLMYMRDETITERNPRDAVLKLIKEINPDIFIHGVVNAGYNSPLFKSRFKEALFYFSALFDMFEANLKRDNQDRTVFEREVLGKKILNVIACEGLERVERPETYKQWQVRTLRVGFRLLPVNNEIMKEVRAKVKSSYPKDFFVNDSNNWLTIGFRGRPLSALSCWKPT